MSVRNISRTAPRSIQIKEFQNALPVKWKQVGPRKVKTPPLQIGLAVSGGVDSMCLAALASRLQQKFPSEYEFKALVVDHKARPASTEQAQTFKKWLEERGLPTSVLELQWPDGTDPIKLKNFESQARTLRYRALGLECRRLGVRTLLMGHHSDDQAETVMSRMVQGHTGSGLSGIASHTPLPECWGYYGIHNTPGGVERQAKVRWAGEPLMINRPLLNYTKDQLRLTCQELGMEWKEDETNADPTLTLRNAVRHLLTKNLPTALNRESLLWLSASVAQKSQAFSDSVEKIYKQFRFLIFDLRSGVLKIRLPIPAFVDALHDNPDDLKPRLAMAMAQIADCVSPTAPMTMSQGYEIAKRIFQPVLREKAFTIGDVLFRNTGVAQDGVATWNVSRRPFVTLDTAEHDKTLRWTRTPTCTSVDQEVEARETTFGNWQLYDGRFWIKISTNRDFESFMVRPLQRSDLAGMWARLRDGKAHKKLERLENRLQSAAPGDIRFSLPALVEHLEGPVLGLPTLGMYTTVENEVTHGVFWQVEYKHVPLYAKERGKVIHNQDFVLQRIQKDGVIADRKDRARQKVVRDESQRSWWSP